MNFPLLISNVIIFVEALLRYFLCKAILPLKKNKLWQISFILGLFLFAFSLQFFSFSLYEIRAAVALLDIAFAFSISKGRKLNRFLLGLLPSVLTVIAEMLCVLIAKTLLADVFRSFSAETDTGELIMSGIFIIIDILLFVGIIQFVKHSNNAYYFSGLFAGVIPVLLVLVFFSVDKITDFLIVFDREAPIRMIEKDLLYILFSLLGIILIFCSVFNLQGIVKKKEKESTELAQRAKLELESFKERYSAVELYQALKHDRREHLRIIKHLVDKRAYDDLVNFTNQLFDASSEYEIQSLTSNVFLDDLLSSKIKDAEKQGITFKTDIQFRGKYCLNDVELCSLFGNVINNAIEACEKIKGQINREIFLGIFLEMDMIHILVENSSDGKYSMTSERVMLTTKIGSGHGIGLKRIKKIVKDANGYIELVASDKNFLITIMLPKAKEK